MMRAGLRGRFLLPVIIALAIPAVGGIFARTVTVRLQVVDAQGHPVSYATVWVGRFDEEPTALAGFMRRTFARAKPAYDFILSVPHSFVEHTDGQGRVEFEDNGGELEKSGVTRIEMVALKRGFEPTFAGIDAKRGSSSRLTLKLATDPAQMVNPRMELLDRAWSLASGAVDAGAKESGKETTDRLVAQLRDLATQFEHEGRNELASAVYFNLAYLPGVDIYKDRFGRVVESGYTRGFDDDNPRRVADRARAMELSPDLRPMREQRVLDLFKHLHVPGPYANPVLARKATAAAEQLVAEFPNTVNPAVLHSIYMGYWLIEDDASCQWLRAFYAYEPAYFDARKTWAKFSAGSRFNRAGERVVPKDCPLPGVDPAH